jgi:DNA polymerase (family 10)
MTLPIAQEIAKEFALHFEHIGVVHICGSIRRGRPEVGDIDAVVVPFDGRETALNARLIELFGTLKDKKKPARSGLFRGAQIDVLIANEQNIGTHLMHWTGSQQENVRLRGAAMSRGMKLSQLGCFYGEANLAAGLDERGVYALLGVPYKEPCDR